MSTPNVLNYQVGKAIVSWKPAGASTYRDLGNVSAAALQVNVEFLDHFSSRAGIRSKDRSVPVELAGEVTLTMDEITAENLAMAVLGTVSAQTSNDPGYDANASTQRSKVDILAASNLDGALRIVGTNSVGRRMQIDLWSVSFKGGSSVAFIGDEWTEVELTGEVLRDENEGSFGRIAEITSSVSPDAPEP
jgi:hypothetical protein